MKNLMLFMVLASVLSAFAAPVIIAAPLAKVTICHIPPDNPDNPQTISISKNAIAAHLKHGDELGECPSGCILDASICDDGSLCTFDECLPNGDCQNSLVDCDDGNLCTADFCDESSGCTNIPADGTLCDDGNACTGDDACINTVCVGSSIGGCCLTGSDCDDGDLCTNDLCTGDSCSNEPVDCAVANQCLVGYCDPGTGGCDTVPVDCDDGNICTRDLCRSDWGGCFYAPVVVPPEYAEKTCDDGIDNDCDGLLDCSDTDCTDALACLPCEKQCGAAFIRAEQACEADSESNQVSCYVTWAAGVSNCPPFPPTCEADWLEWFTECMALTLQALDACHDTAIMDRDSCLSQCE